MQRNSRLAGAEDILRDWNVRIDLLGREILIEAEGQEENKCDGGTRRNDCRAWGKAGALLWKARVTRSDMVKGMECIGLWIGNFCTKYATTLMYVLCIPGFP